MTITTAVNGTVTITLTGSEAADIQNDLLWSAKEGDPLMGLWNALNDAGVDA